MMKTWGPNDENMFRIHGSNKIKISDFSEYFQVSRCIDVVRESLCEPNMICFMY